MFYSSNKVLGSSIQIFFYYLDGKFKLVEHPRMHSQSTDITLRTKRAKKKNHEKKKEWANAWEVKWPWLTPQQVSPLSKKRFSFFVRFCDSTAVCIHLLIYMQTSCTFWPIFHQGFVKKCFSVRLDVNCGVFSCNFVFPSGTRTYPKVFWIQELVYCIL